MHCVSKYLTTLIFIETIRRFVVTKLVRKLVKLSDDFSLYNEVINTCELLYGSNYILRKEMRGKRVGKWQCSLLYVMTMSGGRWF